MQSLICLLFLILLLTVESSIQTEIIFDRNSAWWTPWLYKAFGLSIADFIIILSFVYFLYTLVFFTIHEKVKLINSDTSPYMKVCQLTIIYLFIGFIYNVFFHTYWKAFLYDAKVVLYLTMPYFFVKYIFSKKYVDFFKPSSLLTYNALSMLIDLIIVSLYGESSKPSFLGIPSIPALLDPFAAIIFCKYAVGRNQKNLSYLLLAESIVASINTVSLGTLYNLIAYLLLIVWLEKGKNKDLSSVFFKVFVGIVITNLIAVFMINNPFSLGLQSVKSDGAETRIFQLKNAILNFNDDIPGIIGKGLGSTWYEYESTPIVDADIYSVGTSIDDTAGPRVKFIFNWVPPILVHKWGLLGTTLLSFYTAFYYHIIRLKIDLVKNIDGKNYLIAMLIICLYFIISNTTYIGVLKGSMITAMFAAGLEKEVKNKI